MIFVARVAMKSDEGGKRGCVWALDPGKVSLTNPSAWYSCLFWSECPQWENGPKSNDNRGEPLYTTHSMLVDHFDE